MLRRLFSLRSTLFTLYVRPMGDKVFEAVEHGPKAGSLLDHALQVTGYERASWEIRTSGAKYGASKGAEITIASGYLMPPGPG